jgi:hypothetical protein
METMMALSKTEKALRKAIQEGWKDNFGDVTFGNKTFVKKVQFIFKNNMKLFEQLREAVRRLEADENWIIARSAKDMQELEKKKAKNG